MNSLEQKNFSTLVNKIRKRILSIGLSSQYKAVHYGGALSMVEIIAYTYLFFLRLSISDSKNNSRDRFVLSKGHACLSQYSTLLELNLIEEDDLEFEVDGSSFAGHPVINREKFIDFSTGSLGNGLAYAVGSAISNPNRRVACVIGDGELAEGSIWESLRIASKYKLSNLLIFIDLNGFQQTGETSEINGDIDLSKIIEGFGLNLIKINGNKLEDFYELSSKLNQNNSNVVIAKTIKGFGFESIENKLESHHTFVKPDIQIYQHD